LREGESYKLCQSRDGVNIENGLKGATIVRYWVALAEQFGAIEVATAGTGAKPSTRPSITRFSYATKQACGCVWTVEGKKQEDEAMSKLPMKQLACAIALSGACVTANAEIKDLGTLSVGATPFAGFILGGPPPVSFGDFFTFVLPPNGGSAYTVVNFPIPPLNLDLMFTSLSVFSMGGDAAIGGGDDVLMDSDSGVPGSGATQLSVNIGAQGVSQNMYLAIAGFTTGSAGGAYNGAISISPVPEPEVWAMMLVGVGLVGFRLRNRSKRASASRFA
jgi:hypothetical protein